MKVAIYIEDSKPQIVLTAETQFETNALKSIEVGSTAEIRRGSFYDCQGGWTRIQPGDDSTILNIKPPPF